MRYMLALSITVLAGGLAQTAPAATGWESDSFVDPSGYVQCRYVRDSVSLICRETRRGWSAIIHRSGAAETTHLRLRVQPDYRYVLGYGQTYNAGRLFCRSFMTQMICGNRRSGHGFSISTHGVRAW